MVFSGPPPESERGIGALTLPGLLGEVAARYGDAEALVFPAEGVSMSFDGLAAAARDVAAAILATGCGKGARVAAILGNRPEWVVTAFGAAMAGAVLVPINTWFEPAELEYVLRHSDASILIAQTELAGHRYLEALPAEVPSPEYPYLRLVVPVGDGPEWGDFRRSGRTLRAGVVDAAAAEVTPTDDAVVIYTSGSTAAPKGVLHHQRAVALQSWRIVRHLQIEPGDRIWSAFPMFWTAGMVMFVGATLAGGACLVLQERFEPGEALRLLGGERCTMALVWPHQQAELEGHADWLATDLSALRKTERFGPFGRHPTTNPVAHWTSRAAYGMTETFTIISSDPADTPWHPNDPHSGHLLPGNEVRILDPETGLDTDEGAGEILTRGLTLMRGYLKGAGSGLDEDGWFHTGDAGFVDAAGRLHWTGRTSDLIKTGGANVSPVEIEEALLAHPKLMVARAVGVPDPLLGQMVVVCAVAQAGVEVDEADVRSFLRGRIASYKIPRRVVFVTEQDLDLTGSAKVRVEGLRALVEAALSGRSSPADDLEDQAPPGR